MGTYLQDASGWMIVKHQGCIRITACCAVPHAFYYRLNLPASGASRHLILDHLTYPNVVFKPGLLASARDVSQVIFGVRPSGYQGTLSSVGMGGA